MQPDRDHIFDLLNELPPGERDALLVCSILEAEAVGGPVRQTAVLIHIVSEMSRHLPAEARGVIALRLRDAADSVEHLQMVRID
jgi:hypothetical protein